jgi:hypothetical protein
LIKNLIKKLFSRSRPYEPQGHADGFLAMLVQRSSSKPPTNIWDMEFKVYSQWGEDGILSFLCDELEISKPRMIEFGAGDFTECNSRFLARYRNASVVLVDARKDLLDSVSNTDLKWQTSIYGITDWITPNNVNQLARHAKELIGEIDVVSLDLDGNDYWVAEALNFEGTRIVVVEYNPIFGGARSVTVPRNDIFDRTEAHFSNLYYGASLKAFIELFSRKGFDFVGTNRVGNNAFFVAQKYTNQLNLVIPDISNLTRYVDWRVRESRNEKGELTFLSKEEGSRLISHLPLLEV